MTATRARASLLAAVVLATVLGGCGGQDEADRFRERAEKICADGNAAIAKVSRGFGPDGPDPAQLEEVAPKIPRLMTSELDRLDALEPPADLAGDVDRMIAEFRRVVRTMEEQGTAFFDRPREHFADAYAMAADLGLDSCAE